MTTALVIGAALVGVVLLAFGAVALARRSGGNLARSEAARLAAEHEAKVRKAVADALVQRTTKSGVLEDLEKGQF